MDFKFWTWLIQSIYSIPGHIRDAKDWRDLLSNKRWFWSVRHKQFFELLPEIEYVLELITDADPNFPDSEETKEKVKNIYGRLYREFQISPPPLRVTNREGVDKYRNQIVRLDFFREMRKQAEKGNFRGARRYSNKIQKNKNQ